MTATPRDALPPLPAVAQTAHAGSPVFRVRVAMGHGERPKWVGMIAPGCTFEDALRVARDQFGPDRVLAFEGDGRVR